MKRGRELGKDRGKRFREEIGKERVEREVRDR